MNKHVLISGVGLHSHVLYGKFKIEGYMRFPKIKVTKDALLKHEKEDGTFSNEHHTLPVPKGNYIMGRQVEYNPFSRQITDIWD